MELKNVNDVQKVLEPLVSRVETLEGQAGTGPVTPDTAAAAASSAVQTYHKTTIITWLDRIVALEKLVEQLIGIIKKPATAIDLLGQHD